MNIFTLTGTIFVDNEKANKSISKTDEKAKGLANKLGDGIITAGKWALGIGAAAGAVGGSMLGLASKASEATDRIDKMSNKIGVSKTAFQEWDYVMGQNGMDVEKMEVGMKTLTAAMDGANGGSKKAIGNFETLGLTWEDGTGKLKSQEQMMNEAILALANMENGTEKAKLATELFGKAGIEMMPMLNGGAAGIEELKNRSHELGLVMSDEAVSAGVKFGDTMDDVKDTFGAVVAKIGIEVMPIIQKLLDWILANMPEIQSTVSTVFEVISKVVSNVYNIFDKYILPVFNMFFSFIDENMPTIQIIIKNVFDTIWGVVDRVWGIFVRNLLPILKDFYNFIQPTFPTIAKIVEISFKAVVKSVELVVGIFDKVTGAIKTAIDWLTNWNNKDVKEKQTKVNRVNGADLDGSHASGLAYVPFNGYRAELHEGEGILTAKENKERLYGSGGRAQEITVNTPVYLEGKKITTVTSKIQLQNNKGKSRALGVMPA